MPLRLRPDIATTHTGDGLVLPDEHTGRYWQLTATSSAPCWGLRQGPQLVDQHGKQPIRAASGAMARVELDWPYPGEHKGRILSAR